MTTRTVYLSPSLRKDKKWKSRLTWLNKTVHFGAKGMSDYTIHKDKERKQRYLTRHRVRENWTVRGIDTPGFWARWILWNQPSLHASIRDTEKRFGLKIVLISK